MSIFLGDHPSTGLVDAYFSGMLIGHAVVSYFLPQRYRNIWQAVYIGMEVNSVAMNYSVGFKATF